MGGGQRAVGLSLPMPDGMTAAIAPSNVATLVACPSCGRADVAVRKLANDVDALLRQTDRNVWVAVMGCGVNGPGEARVAE